MNLKKATVVRLFLLVIGIFGAATGLAFGFSNGQVNLIPIPGLTYANPFSGIVIGTISVLLALSETGELYRQNQRTK
jgi:predicted transporter